MSGGLLGRRILLVVDDHYEASELAARLSALGMEVAGPSPNVAHALQQLEYAQGLAGAILDVNLGGEVVFPLADELQRRGVPFIFATGYDSNVIPARHADKILLRKPVDDEAIAAAFIPVSSIERVTAEEVARNGILGRLSPRDLDHLLPRLSRTHLPRGSLIEMQDRPINRVYFPLGCILSSIVVGGGGGRRIEAGLIGREGMTGLGVVDGDDQSPHELINQAEGAVVAMAVDEFRRALEVVPSLAVLARRFARSLGIQVAYTALANGKFEIPPRLARWLLMVQDRTYPFSELRLTHEYLSVMLGVRRPSVTGALHILEGERLVRSTRSHIAVIDRRGLMNFASGIYGVPEAEYTRLMDLPLEWSSKVL